MNLHITLNHEAFLASDIYQSFYQRTQKKIGHTIFVKSICKCCKPPTHEGCVDIKYTSLKECMNGIDNAIHSDFYRSALDECDCELHKSWRRWSDLQQNNHGTRGSQPQQEPMLFWNHLNKPAEHFCEMTCCSPSPFDVMRISDSDEYPTPRLIPIKCVHGCQECGIEPKLNLSACPVFTDPDDTEKRVKMLVWKKNGPQGKNILDNENFSMYDAVQRLKNELEDCCSHLVLNQWNRQSRTIDCKTFKENEAIVFTDFSANPLFEAAKTDVCAVPNHGVLDIFLVLHSPENLTVQVGDEERNVRFNQCDAWHFLGSAAGKAKSSDHVFHNTCLDYIMSQYNHVTDWIIWSDNCSGQYKCQQNFIRIAQPPDHERSYDYSS